jgi:AraC-like DNA-binding protein
VSTSGVTYVERRAIAPLEPFVAAVWEQRVPAGGPGHEQLSIPTGGAELVWRSGSEPLLTGPRTSPAAETLPPGTTVLGWRLRPGATQALFGVPGAELVDQQVCLEQALGARGGRLRERVSVAPDLGEAQRRLVMAVHERPRADPTIDQLVERLGPWGPPAVAPLARELFMSERQLRRRCQSATGLTPKTLQRVLRFQGFVALVQAAIAGGQSPTEQRMSRLAAEAGYADQAHLARECRRLSGRSPSAYVTGAECSCSEHDHAAAFLPLLRSRTS